MNVTNMHAWPGEKVEEETEKASRCLVSPKFDIQFNRHLQVAARLSGSSLLPSWAAGMNRLL